MKLFGKILFGQVKAKRPWQVEPMSVDLSQWTGTGPQAVGVLDYRQGDTQSSVRLVVTSHALGTLQAELKRVGTSAADRILVERIMKRWGREQLEMLALSERPVPSEGFVLEFKSQAPGREALRLLERYGLITANRTAD